MSRPRILVADDEKEIRSFLRAALLQHGYEVQETATARDTSKMLSVRPPDLLILDLGLPDQDGLTVLQELRGWSALPIIVLSARGFEQAKVEALEAGADDYLTKPFGIAELLARIKVALRHAAMRPDSRNSLFQTGALCIDHEKRRVTVDGQAVRLTPTEYKLLAVLAKACGEGHDAWPAFAGSVGQAQRYAGPLTCVSICSMSARSLATTR